MGKMQIGIKIIKQQKDSFEKRNVKFERKIIIIEKTTK